MISISKTKKDLKDNSIAFNFALHLSEVNTRETMDYDAFFFNDEELFDKVEQ